MNKGYFFFKSQAFSSTFYVYLGALLTQGSFCSLWTAAFVQGGSYLLGVSPFNSAEGHSDLSTLLKGICPGRV